MRIDVSAIASSKNWTNALDSCMCAADRYSVSTTSVGVNDCRSHKHIQCFPEVVKSFLKKLRPAKPPQSLIATFYFANIWLVQSHSNVQLIRVIRLRKSPMFMITGFWIAFSLKKLMYQFADFSDTFGHRIVKLTWKILCVGPNPFSSFQKVVELQPYQTRTNIGNEKPSKEGHGIIAL